MSALNPYTDWRPTAEAVRSWPRCEICGEAYGNMAFGSEHYVAEGVCTGYVPAKTEEEVRAAE